MKSRLLGAVCAIAIAFYFTPSTKALAATIILDQDYSSIPAPPLHDNNSRVGQAIPASPTTNPPTFSEIAQTFTVGVSGVLSMVDVLVHREAVTDGLVLSGSTDLTLDGIQVQTTGVLPGGIPIGTSDAVLGSFSLGKDQIPVRDTNPIIDFDLIQFDVASANIVINVGDELAIALRSSAVYPANPAYSEPYVWLGTKAGTGPDYLGGRRWTRGLPGDGLWQTDGNPGLDQAFRTYVDTSPVPIPQPSTSSAPA